MNRAFGRVRAQLSIRCTALILTALLLQAFAALPALAREEIRAFNADLVLDRDGSVRVTETIDINAEGIAIRRGIIRDVPVVAKGTVGTAQQAELTVETVLRDGASETYSVERDGNFERIRIGSKDQPLARGLHRYNLIYRMTNVARRFSNHDGLSWNVTGNGWHFPILTVMANVSLPDGAPIKHLAGFTGALGSTEQAVTIARHGQAMASFQSLRPLAAGEGMTIALSFQKVLVEPPPAPDARGVPMPVEWLAVGMIFLMYLIGAGLLVARRRRSNKIAPRLSPPQDVSPALACFLRNGCRDDTGWTAMIAAIVDMAVQGLVTIADSEAGLMISATGKHPIRSMPSADVALLDHFTREGAVTIDGMGGGRLSWQRAKFMKRMVEDNRGLWFRSHAAYVLAIFVLVFSMIAAMWWYGGLTDDGLIGAAIGTVALGMFGMMAPNLLRRPVIRRLILAGISLFIPATLSGAIFARCGETGIEPGSIMAANLIWLAYGFAMLLPSPTKLGRAKLDEIEGFRRYLEGRSTPANELPLVGARFEALLPYAIALGVERRWSERFELALARDAASAADWERYEPIWYSSRPGSIHSSLVDTISAMPAAMSAAMEASQPSDTSSSDLATSGGSGSGSGGGGGTGW